MVVHCPRCERQYSRCLFQDGRDVLCACGVRIQSPVPPQDRRADQKLLCEKADHVCRMILSSECPDVDIAIERGRVRELAESLFPDRMELYEMIYESRFDRLWEQFRTSGGADAL